MQLSGVPKYLSYDYEADRCSLALHVGNDVFHLYATGEVAQRMLQRLHKDTSGVIVTLDTDDPRRITHFAVVL